MESMESNDNVTTRQSKLPSLPMIALEVFSIVVGVLFALSVSQWNENRKSQNMANEALTHVANEIRANRKIIQKVHIENSELVRVLKDTPADSDYDGRFTPGLQLSDNAWDSLLSSGISQYIDYQTLLEISEIYSYQDVYKTFSMQIVEAIMNASVITAASGNEIDDDRMTLRLVPSFTLVVSVEAHLIEIYHAVLEKLDQQGI